MSPQATPFADPVLDEQTDIEMIPDLPWVCVVWDDPVNLMSYVVYVFRTILGFSPEKARELMMQVHTEGKAIVSTGDRDAVEADVKKLQAAGLSATLQRADQ